MTYLKKAEREELNRLFASVVSLFQSRCYTCHGRYNTKEAFVFHHRNYVDGEKTYADFDGDKLEYHRYLIPIIRNNPKRFRLLHHKHHWLAENWARSKPQTFERTVKLAREINKRKYRLK